jgi:type II secretory pathway component PulJ
MGYSTILDIIGSMAIGGLLLLVLWRLDDSAVQNVINNGQEIALQQNMTTVALILEHDFRKIGYCAEFDSIPDPSKAIIYADSNSIKFLTDDNDDGKVDTMYYYEGPTSELASTPNPRDRFLYRVVNGKVPHEADLGVTRFDLVYYDVLGDSIKSNPVTDPHTISTIEINLTVEDVYAYDNQYSHAFWRQIRLAAQNLRNR